MDREAVSRLLNLLLRTERFGLAVQLLETTPHATAASYAHWQRIRETIQHTNHHAAILSGLLQQLRLPEEPGTFEPRVANFNYQTVDSLVPLLIEAQQDEIATYDDVLSHEADLPAAVAATLRGLRDANVEQLKVYESLQETAPA